GDFVLMPATPGFTLSGFTRATPVLIDPHLAAATAEEVRHGTQEGPPSVRMLGGHFIFEHKDSALLVSLIPQLIHVRGVERLSVLTRLLAEESSRHDAGRELVLTRLIEILLVESLRQIQTTDAPAGLLRGLGATRLAEAIRQMHAN